MDIFENEIFILEKNWIKLIIELKKLKETILLDILIQTLLLILNFLNYVKKGKK